MRPTSFSKNDMGAHKRCVNDLTNMRTCASASGCRCACCLEARRRLTGNRLLFFKPRHTNLDCPSAVCMLDFFVFIVCPVR